ncbi:dihydrolipoyl dehydrogenase family protein [Arthrobacter caoxuetaonis]|uniref:NAD(P)/FAD-dependent oxidoreductase n=1 Tax=Arthrobacter caoxuetaonis TaxID=2886935 RepID=A0A9X1SD57_9MICC|nr:NAD(P)/FAD-dependent oxidoreductase [Arthrobacter caoxuetaonis]MCC3298346.1 NAD(P)/FAD-dependent oxidoreductase [Arthrobacter caoxuetaonis]USQ57637.1 NAD(P)/FAD-dependent oxidoreductase [Arthrobacter caoxuetaonis]
MAETLETDVIVLGAGAVGENAAARVVQGGLEAILVESALVGGECSYWACMPSKALLRPGTALAEAKAVDGSRQAVTGSLDVPAVLKRRDSFTSGWDDAGQVEWVKETGIGLVRGRARLTGERRVEVRDDAGVRVGIQARHAVVLATGASPVTPPLDGLEQVEFWGTADATSSQEVPPRLLVVGGGVAGTELAQAYARLGSEVTMLVRHGLLEMFPRPAAELVAGALRSEGVEILTGTTADRVFEDASGAVVLALPGGELLYGDRLLMATGRRPALDGLGLEDLGLDPHGISCDDSGLVAEAGNWLYVVGDAAGKVLLTHQGKYEARATGAAIAARARGEIGFGEPPRWSRYAATADHAAVPQVVFTDPEVAMVGLRPDQAKERGIRASETSLPISVAGSALFADGYEGWAQMVVDEDRGIPVGFTFAGPGVAELLHAATIAVTGEVPLERLWHAVPAYPTISEIWLRLLEKYGL